jgi:hypothetical protein
MKNRPLSDSVPGSGVNFIESASAFIASRASKETRQG